MMRRRAGNLLCHFRPVPGVPKKNHPGPPDGVSRERVQRQAFFATGFFPK